jgi:hypothetical protein
MVVGRVLATKMWLSSDEPFSSPFVFFILALIFLSFLPKINYVI